MDTRPTSNTSNTPIQITSGTALLARIIRVMVGPVGLVLLGIAILNHGGGWMTKHNLAYIGLFLFTAVARYWEQRSGQSLTLSGAASTKADCRRYLLILLAASAAGWVIANLVGPHIASS